MTKDRRLGRGLAALLSNPEENSTEAAAPTGPTSSVPAAAAETGPATAPSTAPEPAAPNGETLNSNGDMAALARKGVDVNEWAARAEIVHGSAAALQADWQNKFDLVFSNPPFFEAGTIQAPGAGKEAAYLEGVPLKDWINAMLFALRPKGAFVMVHRAADLARILSVVERQSGEITVLPVHSYPGADAKRVLVRARKALRSGPMRLLEPKYLYQSKGGERTDWALAMQRDGAGIDWN